MDGILVVDKPEGMTSHDVVSRVRRIAGQKRVGHAGTLDPAATGVLVVLLGRATKISDILLNSRKAYTGIMVFGAQTDTGDGDGRAISESDASGLTEDALIKAAKQFSGEMLQVPPAYSAIKIGGRAMYKLAREGKSQPEIEARPVTIYDFKITSFSPGKKAEAGFEIACSKGTYIRSLAVDLGQAVGTGGYLKELRRTAAGSFFLKDAIRLAGLSLPDIEENILDISAGLAGFPVIEADEVQAARVMNGFGLKETGLGSEPGQTVAVVDTGGRVLAVHEITAGGGTKSLRVIGEGRL